LTIVPHLVQGTYSLADVSSVVTFLSGMGFLAARDDRPDPE
jgi:hypothetical protein